MLPKTAGVKFLPTGDDLTFLVRGGTGKFLGMRTASVTYKEDHTRIVRACP